jgi:hypothetical protein
MTKRTCKHRKARKRRGRDGNPSLKVRQTQMIEPLQSEWPELAHKLPPKSQD